MEDDRSIVPLGVSFAQASGRAAEFACGPFEENRHVSDASKWFRNLWDAHRRPVLVGCGVLALLIVSPGWLFILMWCFALVYMLSTRLRELTWRALALKPEALPRWRTGMLLLAATLPVFVVFVVKMNLSHDEDHASKSASAFPSVKFTCLGTGTQRTGECPPEMLAKCVEVADSVLCEDEYLRVLTGDPVERWNENGKWSSYKGRFTYVQLDTEDTDGDCYRADHGAAIRLCGDVIRGATRERITGLAQLKRYEPRETGDELTANLVVRWTDDEAVSKVSLGRALALLPKRNFEEMADVLPHISPDDRARLVLVSGVGLGELEKDVRLFAARAAREREAQQKAREQEALRAAEEASERPAEAFGRCADLPEAGRTPVVGLPDVCILKSRLAVVGWAGFEFDDTDDPDDVDNPLSALITQGDSKIDAATRKALRAKALSRTYFVRNFSCDATVATEVSRISLTCDPAFHDLYVRARPTVKRKQECSTTPGSSCDECESHSDCSGWLCGCETSRCTIYGRCTGCPSQRHCEDPEFEVRHTPWTLAATLEGEELSGWEDPEIFVQFRVDRSFRKVTTRGPTRDELEFEQHTRGERIQEHATHVYFRAVPIWAALVRPAAGGLEQGPVLLNKQSWSATKDVDGTSITVACGATECGACAGAKCRVPGKRR